MQKNNLVIKFFTFALSLFVLINGIIVFAENYNLPDIDKYIKIENYNDTDGLVTESDGTIIADLSVYPIAGIKQSTFLIIWTEKMLTADEKSSVISGMKALDPSLSGITAESSYFYYGKGLFEKPAGLKGNFGEYLVYEEDGNLFLSLNEDKVSHFVFGKNTPNITPTGTPATTDIIILPTEDSISILFILISVLSLITFVMIKKTKIKAK